MKHLKKFNESALSIKNDLNKTVNWSLIEDIKDMSLDYIDDGLTLSIYVYNKTFIRCPFITIFYNHYENNINWSVLAVDNIFSYDVKNENVYYKINLQNNLNRYINSDEIIDRAKMAYPNENIR